MKPGDLEKRMRSQEYFRSLRLLPGTWTVIRVDGRGFRRYTIKRFNKPFDSRFRDLMEKTARALLKDLQVIYAYTMSDEISLLLPRAWGFFDRRLEKVVSISAGIASSSFTQAAGETVHFDSRIWLGVEVSAVVDYLCWRQAEAARNALHGWCYWTLQQAGKSAQEASQMLHKKSFGFQNKLLFQYGINFNELPLWQRRGIGLYWEKYTKEGFNPKTGEVVTATRRRIKVDQELPMKEDYDRLLHQIIASNCFRRNRAFKRKCAY
jgi:tRNA(His) 5'-end guanylyltransferase